MGTLIVDTIGGRNDNAPNQSDGLTVTGVCSATDFSGLVGGAADFPNGLTATTVSIAGTLTYDDVTNIDSVGLITARSGVKVTGGSVVVGGGVTVGSDLIHLTDNSKINLGIASDFQIYHDGTHNYIKGTTSADTKIIQNGNFLVQSLAGETILRGLQNAQVDLYYNNSKKIETVGTGVSIYGGMKVQSGFLRESVNIVANKLSGAPTINVDNGMLHYFTTTETTTSKPNIISSAGINTDMAIGDTMCLTVITTAAAAGYSFDWRVDGVEASAGVTSSWVGGSAPSAGTASGLDTYSLTFIKTASARYTMIGNLINSA